MKVALIAAMGRNRVIGVENRLPWSLPADLKYFRNTTRGHCVIMGRKTYESIGRPLPQRTNIVITRNPSAMGPQPESVKIATSLEQALELASASGAALAFVIGGAEIYRLALPKADLIYVTEVDAAPEGDAFFPEWDAREFSEVSREEMRPDAENSFACAFRILERR